MGYFEDVYSSPERHDLRIVEEHVDRPFGWDFDMVVLWEHVVTKKRYWGQDSGCSCPSPFQDYYSVSQLNDYSKTEDEYKLAIRNLGN